MRRVFVDTGGFVALLVAEDQMHGRAAAIFAAASRERWALVTTNAVVVETYSVLLAWARDGRRAAVGFLDAIERSASAIAVESIRGEDENRAFALVRAHTDKSYSLCDALSFVVMERLRISDAIAFDRHFREYGRFTILWGAPFAALLASCPAYLRFAADVALAFARPTQLKPVPLDGRTMTADFKWGTMIVACMRRLRDSGECVVPFIDWEVLPHFDGRSDDIFAWFICDKGVTKDRFRADALVDATRRLCTMAVEAGFPKESVNTIRTDVTSEDDIQSGGGRFAFFR